ncbi:uncharacterized protein N7459_008044 [Penicillium hispanicum]|uniref:uncharacterized protein n=1 Tax=Penicillium hispanicum TaxID=1080232 RepID=UPI00253FA125|nr:uncharacterized protein N7459_008044 [Penicillium hispanicum]KAJ5573617.1 hypothetical protein N7459_008044 [Penicillium hispanicum]
MVEDCGARFETTDIKDCTHVITTQEHVSTKKKAEKIKKALALENCVLVTIDWLTQSIEKEDVIDPQGFQLKSPKKPDLRASAIRRKRKVVGLYGARTIEKKQKTLFASAIDQPILDQPVLGGNPLTEGEVTFRVFMDEQNVAWEAKLLRPPVTLSPMASPEEKNLIIYHIQLLLNGDSAPYLSILNEPTDGRTSRPTRKAYDDLKSAKIAFEKHFQKTCGFPWSKLHDPFKRKGYILISPEDEKHELPEVDPNSLRARKMLPSNVCNILNLITDSNPHYSKMGFLNQYSSAVSLTYSSVPHREAFHLRLFLLEKIDGLLNLSQRTDADVQCIKDLCHCYIGLPQSTRYGSDPSVDIEWVEKQREALIVRYHLESENGILHRSPRFRDDLISYRFYQLLGLKEINVLNQESQEFQVLAEYFDKSQINGTSASIVNIFRIERLGEADAFAKWSDTNQSLVGDRRLLWHGSSLFNFLSILQQGLGGGNYRGAGVYFADFAGKSVGFCRAPSGSMALMLLCEVELGKNLFSCPAMDCSAMICPLHATIVLQDQREGLLASFYPGSDSHRKWRSACCVHPDLDGVKIPDIEHGVSTHAHYGQYLYTQAEYVIREPAQIRHRYLFQIKIK